MSSVSGWIVTLCSSPTKLDTFTLTDPQQGLYGVSDLNCGLINNGITFLLLHIAIFLVQILCSFVLL